MITILNSIPAFPVILIGLGACACEVYYIAYKKQWQHAGILASYIYMIIVYCFIAFGSASDANLTRPFVRIGILLMFLSYITVFIFELLELVMVKHHASK
jgi:hypothetical protein